MRRASLLIALLVTGCAAEAPLRDLPPRAVAPCLADPAPPGAPPSTYVHLRVPS